MDGKDAEAPELNPTARSAGNRDQNLGEFLVAARQRRELTATEAGDKARVPQHYIKMLEAGDYSLISDQLYLLPFLRRYAEFLGLDADEIAMRFVREVQGAESRPIRIPDPPEVEHSKRSGWLTSVAVILFVLVALYLAGIGRHHPAPPGTGEKAAPSTSNSESPPQ